MCVLPAYHNRSYLWRRLWLHRGRWPSCDLHTVSERWRIWTSRQMSENSLRRWRELEVYHCTERSHIVWKLEAWYEDHHWSVPPRRNSYGVSLKQQQPIVFKQTPGAASVYIQSIHWLDGGLTRLHEADDDAVTWLKTTAATALAKWIHWISSKSRLWLHFNVFCKSDLWQHINDAILLFFSAKITTCWDINV